MEKELLHAEVNSLSEDARKLDEAVTDLEQQLKDAQDWHTQKLEEMEQGHEDVVALLESRIAWYEHRLEELETQEQKAHVSLASLHALRKVVNGAHVGAVTAVAQ